MNTRIYNRSVAARTQRTQASTGQKRRKTGQSSHYQVPDDTFGTVRWREEAVDSRGQVTESTTRESLRDDASWFTCESWLPEDNATYGLDEESAWFDDNEEEIVGIVIEPPLPGHSKQKRRSVVSVSVLFAVRGLFLNLQ